MDDMLVVNIFVDEEHIGVFDPFQKMVIHRGHPLGVAVENTFQAFDLIHCFYKTEGETQRQFASRFMFSPKIDAEVDEIPF